MLNSNIKIDLHIHSKASEYKEREHYVEDSNISNIETLLKRLNENEVNLFAITDHNRFDFELYKALQKEIEINKYINVKKNLPGVEFDVQLEENKRACHIICIFEDNDIEKLSKIEEYIEKVRKLKKKEEYYTIEEFESILYKIGLSTILIAHQKTGFEQEGYKTRSLSEGVENPEEWIKTGYINALEYKKTKVQGMIKKNLRDINRKCATITGSDCHVWNEYPNKDKNTKTETVTMVKCLPTFRGLMFAITSVDTRFDRKTITNNNKYISSIKLKGKEIKLSKGINVIIGDNASGKSFLLSKIAKKDKQAKYNIINEKNEIEVQYDNSPEILYIAQNEIINQVRNGELFKNKDFYNSIETIEVFENKLRNFADKLKKWIEKNILIAEKSKSINEITFQIRTDCKKIRYYPILNIDIETRNNEDKERYNKITKIKELLDEEIRSNEKYYEMNNIKIKKVLDLLNEIVNKVQEKYKTVEIENKVINIIISALNNAEIKINKLKTSDELRTDEYIKEIRKSAKEFVNSIKIINSNNEYPEFPSETVGESIKIMRGFEFIKVVKYNKQKLDKEFYKYLFVKQYQSKNEVYNIKTKEEFKNSIAGITSYEDIDIGINNNVSKMIKDYEMEETYVREADGKTEIGNTPGEVALTFYKILFSQNTQCDVILIDQPEDDISVKRIEEYLQNYFNNMRDNKQIIFITHNPLLVVNLDVDNVIYLSKDKNNVIKALSGCLEGKDEKDIIEIVGENLDGGYETIERRLKIYGK